MICAIQHLICVLSGRMLLVFLFVHTKSFRSIWRTRQDKMPIKSKNGNIDLWNDQITEISFDHKNAQTLGIRLNFTWIEAKDRSCENIFQWSNLLNIKVHVKIDYHLWRSNVSWSQIETPFNTVRSLWTPVYLIILYINKWIISEK